MSFWNFLGELALFNVIRNWFTGTPKHDVYPYQQNFSADPDPGYTNQVDALTRKINDMKRELAESKRQHGLTDDEINGLYDDMTRGMISTTPTSTTIRITAMTPTSTPTKIGN